MKPELFDTDLEESLTQRKPFQHPKSPQKLRLKTMMGVGVAHVLETILQ